jgi:hypothetical protein
MDFLLGVFAGAFALPVMMVSLSWWALIIVLFALAATEAVFYTRKNDVGAFIILLLAVMFTALMTTDAEGFWASVWAVIHGTFFAMLSYVILGMIATVPLWLWEVRKHYVDLRDKLNDFIKQKATQVETNSKYGDTLADDDKEICKRYKSGDEIPDFLKESWKKYRNEYLSGANRGMKVVDNISTISSMIFLWPFHIITMIFGDFLAKIPKWFARTFGKALDSLARVTRWGIPSGIDGK